MHSNRFWPNSSGWLARRFLVAGVAVLVPIRSIAAVLALMTVVGSYTLSTTSMLSSDADQAGKPTARRNFRMLLPLWRI